MIQSKSSQHLSPARADEHCFRSYSFWLGDELRTLSRRNRTRRTLCCLRGNGCCGAQHRRAELVRFWRSWRPASCRAVFGLYTVTTYAAADRLKSPPALCASAGLLFAAVAQTVVFNYATRYELALPWTTALLIDAGLMAVVALGLGTLKESIHSEQFAPMLRAGCENRLRCSPVLTCGQSFSRGPPPGGALFPRLLALATVWLIIAWSQLSPAWFSAFQVCLAVGGVVWRGD